MPLARIDIARSASRETVAAVQDTIYDAMVAAAAVPENDKFQVVTRHDPDELVYPAAGYLGVSYSPAIVFIQITWNAGRTIEVKKALYKAIADGIHARTGIRREDVFIQLVEVARENWSFGNGEMQYAAKQ